MPNNNVLTDDRRDAIEYAIQVLQQVEAGDGTFVGQCADAMAGLESILAAHPGQPETRAEVTKLTVTVGRLLAMAPHFEECETSEPCLSALIHRYYENDFGREKGREYAELYIAALYEVARAGEAS
jgi:hypothetical protein